ncbi:hypothetical protein KY306_02825 [Candidatus Woesearchaeota archaeon]|nr:hypothetical protein [Candidatus Woesearchaeota archaeon]
MGFFHELRSRLELYFAFTTKEVRDILICVVVSAFIFSFNDWGRAGQFDLIIGFKNMFLVALLAALAFFVHLSFQRVVALMIGFKAEFKVWWGGLVASFLIVFITASIFNLGFTVILPGGMVIAMLVRHRLGEFRYGVNYWENGIIALWGPIGTMMLAFVFKILLIIFPHSWFLQKGLLINLIYGVCSMLPIPPLDGINVFFAGRVLYAASFGIILGIALLIYWANLWLTIFGGVLIGLAVWILFFLYIEPK